MLERRIVTRAGTVQGARMWGTADALHVDLRGLDPPAPMVQILRIIDEGEIGAVLVAHLDREPVFLYPELDDRGWRHEIVALSYGEPGRVDEVKLRMTRAET